MTTIAWDGKTLAGDTVGISACMRRRVQKIFRLSSGDLFGAAGEYDEALLAKEWLEDQSKSKPTLKDFSGLLITEDGAFKLESALIRMPILEPFHAIGSGRDFAIMAMHLGKTAREAVELTLIYDAYSGGPVETLELAANVHLTCIKQRVCA